MDEEKDLTEEMLEVYVNEAADALNRIPRGDPRSIRATAELREAYRILEAYRQEKAGK